MWSIKHCHVKWTVDDKSIKAIKLSKKTRHQSVCHTWLMTVQCISLFGLRELTPASKFTKTGDDLLPTQVYHPTEFHRPASTQASDIHYKNLQTNKQRNSKRYIPSMPISMWGQNSFSASVHIMWQSWHWSTTWLLACYSRSHTCATVSTQTWGTLEQFTSGIREFILT